MKETDITWWMHMLCAELDGFAWMHISYQVLMIATMLPAKTVPSSSYE
jgi:hypothetical protein